MFLYINTDDGLIINVVVNFFLSNIAIVAVLVDF